MKKDVQISGEILEAINRDFESYDNFVELFKQSAVSQFGSGWAWLVLNPQENKLEIMQTHDQESPISQNKIPLLVVDVWEHAYYLKYQNKRPEYVDAFMNVINWEKVNDNYLKATQR
jgi:Fe-Mn family superoxide dismutase